MGKRVEKIKKFTFAFIIILLITIGGRELLQENSGSNQSSVTNILLESMNKDGGFVGFNEEKGINYYNTYYNRLLLDKPSYEIEENYEQYIKEDFSLIVGKKLTRPNMFELRYLSEVVSKHQIELEEEKIKKLINKLEEKRKNGLYSFSEEEKKVVEKISPTLDALIIIKNITGKTPELKQGARSFLFESIEESKNRYKASLYSSYKEIINLQGSSLTNNEKKEIRKFLSNNMDINFEKNPEVGTLQALYLSQLSVEVDFEDFSISDRVYEHINTFKTTDEGYNMYSKSTYDPKLTYEINKYFGVDLSGNLIQEINYSEISPSLYTHTNINSNIIQTYRAIRVLGLVGENVPDKTIEFIKEYSKRNNLSGRELYFLTESKKLLGLPTEDLNFPTVNNSPDETKETFYDLLNNKNLDAAINSLQNSDGGYGLESSNLYETYLVVENVSLNQFTNDEKKEIIDFVLSFETEESFGRTNGSLDKTYHAIKILDRLGYSDIEEKIIDAKKFVKRLKNETGTYSEEKGNHKANLRDTYYAMLIEKLS